MIHVIPRVFFNVGFGTATQQRGLSDGQGDFTAVGERHPVPIDGLVRNLVAKKCGPLPADVTVRIKKNLIATALTTTLTVAGPEQDSDVTNTVSFTAGDVVQFEAAGSNVGPPGYDLGMTAEVEADAMIYGICASSGTYTTSTAKFGGALGNGIWQNFPAGSDSNTYSISPLNGSITILMLQRYVSPAGGSFVGWIRLNGVTQDGAVGTVDTTCTLLDSGAATMAAMFDLPIGIGDHVDILVKRFGTTSAFAVEQIGAAVAVTPNDGSQFALCGGNNSTIPTSGTTWKWNASRQNGSTIQLHTAAMGVRTLYGRLLYIERTNGPGVGDEFIHTLLKNDLATELVVSLTGLTQSGSDSGTVQYDALDTATIEVQNIGSVSGAELHWGAAVSAVLPPPPPECPGEVSGVRTDGLPYVPPTAEACSGTGERGAPRTGA